MNFSVRDEVEDELLEAAAWYEARGAGLGIEFINAVERAYDLIRAHPCRYSHPPNWRSRLDVRRFLLERFSYAITYLNVGERIVILAISHTARRPGYWRKRLRE